MKCRKIDPILFGAISILLAVAVWTMSPLATSAIAPASSTTRIEVQVDTATSVTPGWRAGDAQVRLPDISVPGVARDVTSSGWRLTSNWGNGYEVRVRATTDPALRGSNALDGKGARASFQDYKASGCPCAWDGTPYSRGIFGYSVSVTTADGTPSVEDTSKWGTMRERMWRGFTREAYPAYATPGGAGEYTMSLHLRSMIPDGAVQPEGSYRAGLVVSAHPRF